MGRSVLLALVRSEIAQEMLDKASAVLFADRAKILRELSRIVMAVESEPADNYYATQSSNQFIERIRVPCLIVHAKDDPLIPFEVYDHAALKKNSWVRLLAIEHGGHLGFLSKNKPRFWLDGVLIEWIQATIRDNRTGSCARSSPVNSWLPAVASEPRSDR